MIKHICSDTNPKKLFGLTRRKNNISCKIRIFEATSKKLRNYFLEHRKIANIVFFVKIGGAEKMRIDK